MLVAGGRPRFGSHLARLRQEFTKGWVKQWQKSWIRVVASFFEDCEIIQRVALRRGNTVMRSRFLNVGDGIHDQVVRERIASAIQRIPPRLLILADSQLCHLSASERAD